MSRPEFKPTDELREKVSIWRAGGMSKDDIALALDIDVKTLTKHFSHELDVVSARKKADVLESQFRAARRGNVAAQRAFLASAGLAPTAAPRTAPKAEATPKEAALGKKETRARNAKIASEGTSWDELVTH